MMKQTVRLALKELRTVFISLVIVTMSAAFLVGPVYSEKNSDENDFLYRIKYKSRFVSDENTVIDTKKGIMWPKNFHPFNLWTTVGFEQAEAEVQRLRDICYLGYCDWRVPTERDFKSIIDRDNINPALVYPHPFENVETHYPYWTQNPVQELATDRGICAIYLKVVRFWAGEFEQQNKNEGALLIPNRIHDPDKYYSR
ncbi:MAG TPA: DUF1566 domain-containing protein [Nitrospirae bacterium]|nr:DUF1566 domain-containing protein [Nitrospirota bacterium]